MFRKCFKLPLLLLIFLTVAALPARGAEKVHQEFKLDQKPGTKGNIFNLFFGSPPPMPTDRGTLIIDAFLDRNGNKKRDIGERVLQKEISCRVDGIDYPVPAFIPGLKYNGSYQVDCTGSRYHPLRQTRDILIGERGQIIEIDLACKRTLQPKSESLAKKK